MTNMKLRIIHGKRMYKSEAGKTFWLEQLNDFDNLMSPEQVKNDEVSFQSKMATELFKEKDPAVFCKAFWLMWNHLFLWIRFSNGYRSRVSLKMMLQEFKRVEQQYWNYVLHVMKDKTTKTSGPAVVTLIRTQVKCLGIYLKN